MRTYLLFFLVLFSLFFQESNAQLGFCSGNYGDAIFTETFGTGIQNGPPLPPGTTTYPYVDVAPADGEYTIWSQTDYYDWHHVTDHTGDTNGKLLIVNASHSPGEFFQRTVSGLCENTSYEFSSWIINLQPDIIGCGLPINVKFEIWDSTNTRPLASGDTGNISNKDSPVWEQYALVFQTLPGQTSVILKMLNNGAGGCGNDVGIDDIVFKSCGDTILITDSTNSTSIALCENQAPTTTTLTAYPDFSVFQSHAYQWQESADGTDWKDLVGETTSIFTTPQLNVPIFYRVKVAEDAINLRNSNCNVFSNLFHVTIAATPNAPVSQGDVELCVDNLRGVQVSVPDDVLVNWYDASTGGNLLVEDSELYSTTTSGTYYAEAVTKISGCFSDTRTAVSITYSDLPVIDRVVSDYRDLTILMINSGDFEYSLDGLIYQQTPLFKNLPGGVYNAFVRRKNSCGVAQLHFVHLVIPHFFTPNGDDINDGFSLEGAEFVDTFKISIFNRTSRILFQSTDKNFSWDGMFNNRPLPSSSYWYRIETEQSVFRGHFALKR